MKNDYFSPGTTLQEVGNNIGNDSNIREGKQRHYLYPQFLYKLLLQRKDVNAEFIKLDQMCIKVYN
jgi:hypothetical protein